MTTKLPKNIKANAVLSKTKKKGSHLMKMMVYHLISFAGLFEDKNGAIWSCLRSGTAWKYEGFTIFQLL